MAHLDQAGRIASKLFEMNRNLSVPLSAEKGTLLSLTGKLKDFPMIVTLPFAMSDCTLIKISSPVFGSSTRKNPLVLPPDQSDSL